jgi:hypothetical protein
LPKAHSGKFSPHTDEGYATARPKVIPPDPRPEEVGERFEFSWIVPKDRPWQVGDRLAVKFFEFGELLY